MLSMEPSIKRGLTFWDRALMSRDEFFERIRLVRGEMRRMGLDALVVSGNMYEDADLLYLVGGNVDGTLVLTLDGDPSIFTASGSRESFFLREQTWIDDVSYQGGLVGTAVRAALHARRVTSGRVGAVGLQVLPQRAYRNLIDALDGYALHDFSAALLGVRSRIRPRELTATRIALGIAEKAANAAEQLFANGASNAAAVVEAERVARLEGAWDFRALANIDSDDLRPFERPSDERRGPLLLWVATRYQGYWADRVVGSAAVPGSEAALSVAAMTKAVAAGVAVSTVAQAGLAPLSDQSRRSALAYGLGHGIGIELNGSPKIAPQSNETIAEGALLSFRVFARGGQQPSFASALIRVGADGAVPLTSLSR